MPATPALAAQKSWFARYVGSWIPACSQTPTWVDKIPFCLTKLFVTTQNARVDERMNDLKQKQDQVAGQVDSLNAQIGELKTKSSEYTSTFLDLKSDVSKRLLAASAQASIINSSQVDVNAILEKRTAQLDALKKQLKAGVANLEDLNRNFENFKDETTATIALVKENQAYNFKKLKEQVVTAQAEDSALLADLKETAQKNNKIIENLNEQIAQMNQLCDQASSKRVLLNVQIDEVHTYAKKQSKQLAALATALSNKPTRIDITGKF
jgi:chromosome segregation ATPase